MSMSTQRRHGSFKNLSSRLGFRHGNRQRANSSSAATATAVPRAFHKSLGNASLVEPRTSAATSAESELSETSTSTVGSPPRERPLNARSYSVADTQGLRDERALAAAAAEGTGGQIRVVFGKDEEFSSTGGKALGLTVSPAKDVGRGVSGQGAVIESLSGRMGGAPPTPAGDNAARPVRERQEVNSKPLHNLCQILDSFNGCMIPSYSPRDHLCAVVDIRHRTNWKNRSGVLFVDFKKIVDRGWLCRLDFGFWIPPAHVLVVESSQLSISTSSPTTWRAR